MANFIDIREPRTNRLLFRYDPERQLIEIQRRGIVTLIDLTKYKNPTSTDSHKQDHQQHDQK